MLPHHRRRRVSARLVVAVAAIAAGLIPFASEAAGQPVPAGIVTYQPPVAAPVLDPFRPPASRYGPGNRGIEYDTMPGEPVLAAADGVVVFAGPVAGELHVTIGHADGVRTSYSFLGSIVIANGQRVAQGSRVGTAGDTFHFGARIGDVYIDPAALFGSGPTEVALIPDDRPLPASPGPVPPSSGSATMRVVPTLPGWFDSRPASDVLVTLADWQERRGTCTPPSDPVPDRADDRRIAVLVGGLGSSSGRAAITGLDTTSLEFAEGDVVRFSYAGGRVPGTGAALDGITARHYAPADTLGDLRVSGERLADLLQDVAAAAPGATIDLLAHSQGGIVSRLALAELATRPDEWAGVVERLGVAVTIGSSHQGADLATLVRALRSVPGGDLALEVGQAVVATPIEPDALAVAQLAEGSALLADLAARPPPAEIDLWSIGARGDLVVSAPRARLDGAVNVTVAVDGLATDHEQLPAAPAVTREIGLALAGLGPTCESVLDALADSVIGATISWVESGFGLVPGAGATS